MFRGFRDFILRGDVIDLAVAVVIGAAFGAVIASFVADILTPLLGLLGVPDFSGLSVSVGAAEVRYGLFLNALITFVLVAAAIYLFIIKPKVGFDARMAQGGGGHHQDVPPLRHRYPHRRQPLSALHQPADLGHQGV